MSTAPVIRLQKYLARAGVASRRDCAALIEAGQVQVNGQIIKEPFHRVKLGEDEVRCEGKLLKPAKPVYYKLHKPSGVLSAMGEAELPTLSMLLPGDMTRVFPVGRLDFDASGILLLTNDGDLANLLLHPRYHVSKEYRVRVKPCPSRQALKKLEEGMVLEGVPTKPATWEVLERREGRQAVLRVVLTEGRRNQIKRMLNSVGSQVRDLVRIRFGPLLLGHLKSGRFQKLSPAEVNALKRAAAAAQEALAGSVEEDGEDG